MDSSQYLIREAKGTEKTVLIVLMHGYAANKADLLSLAQYFPENYIVATPNATFQIGPSNYQWYTIEKDEKGNPKAKTGELKASITRMENFISFLQGKYSISADRTFIGGFSQGAIMSYQIGLRNPNLIKGIGVLSGIIFNELKELKDKDQPSDLHIFIGQGEFDDRVTYAQSVASKTWLEERHYSVEFHTYKGMGHSISEQEILDLVAFAKKIAS